jgi:hypothetical protein
MEGEDLMKDLEHLCNVHFRGLRGSVRGVPASRGSRLEVDPIYTRGGTVRLSLHPRVLLLIPLRPYIRPRR